MRARGAARWTLPVAALAPAAAAPAGTTIDLQHSAGTPAAWHLTAIEPPGEAARTGNDPAQLCFWTNPRAIQAHCTKLLMAHANSIDTLVYQTATNLSGLTLTNTPAQVHAVLARALMSYGGSGTSVQYSVWTYNAKAGSFQNAATVALSGEESAFDLVDHSALAGRIITADAAWAAGETHVGRHHYAITVRRLNDSTPTYSTIMEYLTPSTHPGLDETDKIELVSHELPTIQRLLQVIGTGR